MAGRVPQASGTGRADLPALLLFAFCAALFASVKVSDSDLWWHLAGGRLILEQGLPSLNTFSHTWGDHPWHYTQWLFGTILYLVQAAGGILAVEAVQVTFVTAAFTLALHTARLRFGSLPWLPLLPIFVLALSASRLRFVPRPHLVTFLGLSLLLWLWERKPKLLPLWFGIVGLVWGNCHAGTVFGIVVMGAIAVDTALKREAAEFRRALLCTGAFFVCTLMNPDFFYQYLYSFGHLSVGQIVPLYEFAHASPAAEPLFFLYAALVFAAVPLRLRRRDYLFPLLALPFFLLSWDAIRVIPKFVLVTLPGLCLAVADLRSQLGGWAKATAVAALAALCAVVAFLGVREWRQKALSYPFGWGLNARFLPEAAIGFVQRHGLDGHLYNDFDQGGYLIWRLYPERRVFQDGRVQAYPAEFFQELMGSHGRDAWARRMERYGVDYAVVSRRAYSGGIDGGVLFESLGWPLVHLDGNSYVFVKPGSANDAKTADLRLRLIRSNDSAEALHQKATSQPAVMAADLRRIEPESLLSARDFLRFAAAAFAAGDAELSERFFKEGLAQHPEDLTIRINFAFLMVRLGRQREAREEFSRVAAMGKGTALAAKADERLKALPP